MFRGGHCRRDLNSARWIGEVLIQYIAVGKHLPQGYSMEDFISYVRAQIGEWIYEFAHERI